MQLKLHANATTTPKTRTYIQASTASVAELALELGHSQTTIRRWRNRKSVADRSHTPHKLAISLTQNEEQLVIELRKSLALPLDDIVEVMRRCCNPKLSRSAIHRCLKRHGISARAKAPKPPFGAFEDVGIGFIHIDLKHLTKLEGQSSYVFVAIDRATRYVYIEIVTKRSAAIIAGCLERFIACFPYKVHTILTDNGAEFTDRFGGARWRKKDQLKASGKHCFDQVCTLNEIEHRLIKPGRPQTNGMVERFNRRLAEAIRAKAFIGANSGKNKFENHEERNAFLNQFVHRYNRTRLKCLDYKAPFELLNNHPGPNTSAGTGFLLIML